MAEATHPLAWPKHTGIHESFNSLINEPSDETSGFYGSFIRVLNSLFSIEGLGPYEIAPQVKKVTLQGSQNCFVTALVVHVNYHPVFFIEVNHPAAFLNNSSRQEADKQMRCRFRDLSQTLAIPILHGVSAFGTRLSFYEYNSETRVLQPEQVLQPHPSVDDDVAPITHWNYDILQPEGANRLREVINHVKEMSAHICQ